MRYDVVYDLRLEPPFSIEVAGLAAGLFLLGVIWAVVRRRQKQKPTTGYVIMGFASLIAIFGVGMMSWDHARLLSAIDRGEAKIATGPIGSWSSERVRTARTDRHEYRTYERFYIGQEVWFGYYWDVEQAGFHNAYEPRIVLRDGLQVRAKYLYADGEDQAPRIVLLEIAK